MHDSGATGQPTHRRVHHIGAVRPPLTYEETVARRACLMFEDISEAYAFARWMMDMWGLRGWNAEFPSLPPPCACTNSLGTACWRW